MKKAELQIPLSKRATKEYPTQEDFINFDTTSVIVAPTSVTTIFCHQKFSDKRMGIKVPIKITVMSFNERTLRAENSTAMQYAIGTENKYIPHSLI